MMPAARSTKCACMGGEATTVPACDACMVKGAVTSAWQLVNRQTYILSKPGAAISKEGGQVATWWTPFRQRALARGSKKGSFRTLVQLIRGSSQCKIELMKKSNPGRFHCISRGCTFTKLTHVHVAETACMCLSICRRICIAPKAFLTSTSLISMQNAMSHQFRMHKHYPWHNRLIGATCIKC